MFYFGYFKKELDVIIIEEVKLGCGFKLGFIIEEIKWIIRFSFIFLKFLKV